jgi:hypothetical protein
MALINECIGNPHSVVLEYFERIHWWMPVICHKPLKADMLAMSASPGAELPILVLAMKVLLWNPSLHPPATDPKTQAYMVAKHTTVEAVTAGNLTLRLLQAQLLIAMYEVGHAIYPAANLSIGACARYGVALGVNTSLRSNLPLDSVESEERRRTWWAILILDR